MKLPEIKTDKIEFYKIDGPPPPMVFSAGTEIRCTMTFGGKLKEKMRAFGFTQAELSDKLGVQMRQVQRYEKGTASPRIETVNLLNKIFKYDFFAIMKQEVESNTNGRFEESKSIIDAKILDKVERIEAVAKMMLDIVDDIKKEVRKARMKLAGVSTPAARQGLDHKARMQLIANRMKNIGKKKLP